MLRRRIDPAPRGRPRRVLRRGRPRGQCEELVRLRLLVRSGHHYEFANDLLQECVHAALPPALALALPPAGRRPDQRPARGDGRARVRRRATSRGPPTAGCWPARTPCAGRPSRTRSGCWTAPSPCGPPSPAPGPVPCWRAARSTRPARTSPPRWATYAVRWPSPGTPTTGGSRWPRSGSWAATLPWGSVCPSTSSSRPLELGLRLAADLGDRRAEADFTSRLAILEASRLRLATALARAEARAGAGPVGGLARTRWCWRSTALKTVLGLPRRPGRLRRGRRRPRAPAPRPRGHLAAPVDRLREVVRARRRGASGRRPCPGRRGAGAQPAQRLPGVRRLPPRPRRLVRPARRRPGGARAGSAARPLEASSPIDHPWWYAIAAGLLAATLIETGDHAEAEADRPARAGRPARRRWPVVGCGAWRRWRR